MNFWKGALTLFLLLLLAAVLGLRRGDARLLQADKSYRQGEEAATIFARGESFNHALDLYQQLEQAYRPEFGSGKLYYNLGNAYFQLGAYPWAIFYYKQAELLLPRDPKVQHSLEAALDKLSLPKSPLNPFEAFSLNRYFSLPERLQIFFLFALAAFFLGSIAIWQKSRWARIPALIFAGLAGVFLLSAVYTRYFSSLEAVIVRSVALHFDAGINSPKVGNRPVPAGTTVKILSVLDEGAWLKVMTPEGELGDIPNDSARVIRF